MNIIRSKYFHQIGHFCAGYPENLEKVDEFFLRELEESVGIQEREVGHWRKLVFQDFLDGKCERVDARMGYVLAGCGELF